MKFRICIKCCKVKCLIRMKLNDSRQPGQKKSWPLGMLQISNMASNSHHALGFSFWCQWGSESWLWTKRACYCHFNVTYCLVIKLRVCVTAAAAGSEKQAADESRRNVSHLIHFNYHHVEGINNKMLSCLCACVCAGILFVPGQSPFKTASHPHPCKATNNLATHAWWLKHTNSVF